MLMEMLYHTIIYGLSRELQLHIQHQRCQIQQRVLVKSGLFRVTPKDQYTSGIPTTSDPVTVINSLPEVSNVQILPNPAFTTTAFLRVRQR